MFRVWPETGRYWCRACGKAGNEIDYLRERRGLSFKEACLFLGHNPGLRKHSPQPAPSWSPREAAAPKELWHMKARNFLAIAINSLWSKQGESIKDWLKAEKGLSDATIKKSMLGYSPMDIDEPRAAWGLEPLLIDGLEQRQRIPKGLVIPLIKKNKVMRLRIRRDNPGKGPRYVVISGSSAAPLIIDQDNGAVVVVESELDAWLLSQEAGDLCSVVAMGNAQAKPDIEIDKLLQNVPVILISLDTDDTGMKASWNFWRDNYQAKRCPAIKGKDPSEARLNGLDLRGWIIAGMFGSEEKFERFCIQTIDGGLSDCEAIGG
jgi:DNA primase